MPAGASEDAGKRIYRQLCASCHGVSGEGVKGRYSRPLAGNRSVSQLARYIERAMPDDGPEKCEGEDAEKVARYIHGAFYSPIARARNRGARIELSRLTVRQYRNAAADLIGSFRGSARPGEEHGLRGQYFNSRRPAGRGALERIDGRVCFDFGRSSPAPEKLDPGGFSARWQGSVIAPDTGSYEFILRTDHAARLWINDPRTPLIDAWVKSGDDREYTSSIFLIGGRAYGLRLEFTSRDQGVEKKGEGEKKPAFIELHWKLPGRASGVIPGRFLSPGETPEVFLVQTPFPPDDRSTGYERGTSLSRAWDAATTAAAIEAADYITDSLDELAGLRGAGADRESKVRRFCRQLVERAFRRPLTGEQEELYINRQFAGAPDLETAVKRVVLLALKSPRFLYLDLPGGGAHAAASRLSFALWDSLPDRELLEAAASGQLTTREQVARQARRMVQDPRTRSKALQFLHHWLDVEHLPDLAKDKRFPRFNEALASDLRASLDLFLDDVMESEDADFRQLLLSNDLYLNGRLAGYYGFDLPPGAPFKKVAGKGPRRAGVLSHPYLMARFAYTDSSSPIHRGVFLIRSVLGRTLLPPPEAFTPLAPDLHPDLTTRERVLQQTRPEACQGCHGRINPLGFTLEHFDATGRYREEERGKPIDSSGSCELPSGKLRTLDNARDLAEFLAGSEEAQRSFAVQLFHHMVKQPILALGPDAPENLRRTFAARGFNIRKLMVEIAIQWAGSALETSRPDPSGPERRRF